MVSIREFQKLVMSVIYPVELRPSTPVAVPYFVVVTVTLSIVLIWTKTVASTWVSNLTCTQLKSMLAPACPTMHGGLHNDVELVSAPAVVDVVLLL